MKEQDEPIEAGIKEQANGIARVIDEAINPDKSRPDQYGFALLMFKFGEEPGERRMNYISNASREDMLAAMKEFIARSEGYYREPSPLATKPPDPTKR